MDYDELERWTLGGFSGERSRKRRLPKHGVSSAPAQRSWLIALMRARSRG